MVAKFHCLKCKAKWSGSPQTALQGCPQCGHFYVEWVNFEAWQKQAELSHDYRKVYPKAR